MPLRLRLKPHEKLVIGSCVIENGPKSTSFLVHSKTTILREKDILTEEEANTPAKRVYYSVLLMYLAGSIDESADLHSTFFELSNQFLEACPSQEVIEIISELGTRILEDDFYGALKSAQSLIKYEKKILFQD